MPWRFVHVEPPLRRRRRVWMDSLTPAAPAFVPARRRRPPEADLPEAARRHRRWDGSLSPPDLLLWTHRRRRLGRDEPPEAGGRRGWRFPYLPNLHRAAVSPSVVFSATASATIAYPAASAFASIVFHVAASQSHAPVASAAVSVVFAAVASQTQTHAGVSTASIVFSATALRRAPATVQGAAAMEIRFRVRARGKRPGVKFGDGYLGRYQIGQDVPLLVQCVDNNGDAAAPSRAPLARIYREGVFLRAVEVPAETDPDVTGRFRGRYTLGDGDATGHYGIVYLYGTLGLQRGECAQFECVAGGDPSGPVLAGYSYERPDGDYLLAHLAAGRLASGQTPYLDEGI